MSFINILYIVFQFNEYSFFIIDIIFHLTARSSSYEKIKRNNNRYTSSTAIPKEFEFASLLPLRESLVYFKIFFDYLSSAPLLGNNLHGLIS